MTDLPPVSRTSALLPTLPHADAAAKAKADLTGGKAGRIYGETLDNGTRLIIAERPGAKKVKVQIGAGAGSLEDPKGKLGLAHMLEHLAFEGSPTTSSAKQERLRTQMGGVWNAYTDRDSTIYYGVVPNKDANKGANLLGDMFANPATTGPRVKQELAAVKNEMLAGDGSISGELWHINERLLHGDHALTNNVIGSRPSVEAITGKDLKAYHQSYYTGRNTVALVEGDPKHLPLEAVRKQLSALAPGARVDHDGMKRDFVDGPAVQMVPDAGSGKVGITLSIPVSNEAVEKAKVSPDFVISTIGNVFYDRLRRNHHLTYGVQGSIYDSDSADGKVIEFSTDVAPENARAAVRDLVDTLHDARDGFGPETFKLHKQQALSRKNMSEPAPEEPVTVSDQAEALFQGTISTAGLDLPDAEKVDARGAKNAANTATAKLRAASYKRYAETAKSLIDLSDMKILAHGPASRTDIMGGIKDSGVKTGKIKLNPVDLSLYEDMGVVAKPAPKPRRKSSRSHSH